MKNIKTVLLVSIFPLIMMACQTLSIPKAYQYKPKQIQNNPYGCWSVFIVMGDSLNLNSVEGELLSIQHDTIYLLTDDTVVKKIPKNKISSAELYTHQNQANTYLLISGILIAPSILGAITYAEDYAGSFLVLGIPAFVGGLANSGTESGRKNNILRYPTKNSLDQFNNFSRYPAGLPPLLNFRQLLLKT